MAAGTPGDSTRSRSVDDGGRRADVSLTRSHSTDRVRRMLSDDICRNGENELDTCEIAHQFDIPAKPLGELLDKAEPETAIGAFCGKAFFKQMSSYIVHERPRVTRHRNGHRFCGYPFSHGNSDFALAGQSLPRIVNEFNGTENQRRLDFLRKVTPDALIHIDVQSQIAISCAQIRLRPQEIAGKAEAFAISHCSNKSRQFAELNPKSLHRHFHANPRRELVAERIDRVSRFVSESYLHQIATIASEI